MLESLTADQLQSFVGSRFELRHGEAPPNPLELTVAEPIRAQPVPDGRQPFSLVFQADDQLELLQAIYTLRHRELGSLELFLVPIQPGERGSRFEAVFT